MDQELKDKIISEYLSGKGSTTIERELKVYKPGILKVLKDSGITRKRDRCKSLKIIEDSNSFYVIHKCPSCGGDIKISSKTKIIACRNHYNAINKNSLCKPCSLKLQLGEGNPFYGKKHKIDSKRKMSDSRKGKGTGKNNAMSNDKWRQKARKNLIKKWESGDLDHMKKRMSEKMKETRRFGKLKSVIVSKKELEIIQNIKSLGFEVIGSYKVDTKICDVYIPKLNLIIEYNGDYWHCNPKKYDKDYFNVKKNKYAWEIWDYDKSKLDLIKNEGYNLEVIWEGDLKNNNKLINNIIKKYVKNNFSTS